MKRGILVDKEERKAFRKWIEEELRKSLPKPYMYKVIVFILEKLLKNAVSHSGSFSRDNIRDTIVNMVNRDESIAKIARWFVDRLSKAF